MTWVLEGPRVTAPSGHGAIQYIFRFDTKKKLDEYCKREKITAMKKSGTKYTFVIVTAPAKYFKYSNKASWNFYTGLTN